MRQAVVDNDIGTGKSVASGKRKQSGVAGSRADKVHGCGQNQGVFGFGHSVIVPRTDLRRFTARGTIMWDFPTLSVQ